MGHAVFFRCFQDEWHGVFFGVFGNGSEPFNVDEAFADVTVAIYLAAELFDGIVEMKARKGIEADELVVLLEGLVYP